MVVVMMMIMIDNDDYDNDDDDCRNVEVKELKEQKIQFHD